MSASFPGLLKIASFAMLASTIGLAAVTPAAADEGCMVAWIGVPFELPDGTAFPATTLSICASRTVSPVAALHRISVGGNPIGVLLSRAGRSEGVGASRPTIMFRRVDAGRLRLIGYSWPSAGRSKTYALRETAQPIQLASSSGGGSGRAPDAPVPEGPTVLFAARAQ